MKQVVLLVVEVDGSGGVMEVAATITVRSISILLVILVLLLLQPLEVVAAPFVGRLLLLDRIALMMIHLLLVPLVVAPVTMSGHLVDSVRHSVGLLVIGSLV